MKIKDYRANTVDPDEMVHNEPSHLDLQCFANSAIFVVGALYKLKCVVSLTHSSTMEAIFKGHD